MTSILCDTKLVFGLLGNLQAVNHKKRKNILLKLTVALILETYFGF